jgi:hypothetical protein
MERFYLPVLKAKSGEFIALNKLNPSIKSWVYPLLEITKVEFDNEDSTQAATLKKHLQKLCDKIVKKWPYDHSFIDAGLIKNETVDEMSAFEFIYSLLSKSNVLPMPVARLDMPTIAVNGLKAILKNHSLNKIGIRVTIEDIESPELASELDYILANLELSPTDCHMIFDLMDSDFSKIADFSDSVAALIETFPRLKEWRTFTLTGGAFPQTAKLNEGIQEIIRGDWELYKMVSSKLEGVDAHLDMNYGDYSVVAPGHFVFDPVRMQISANIRYTYNGHWYVVKGKSLKLHKHIQYFDIANKIRSSGYFLGETYSSLVWNWVACNHHITKVVNDLFASQFFSSSNAA